MSSDRDGTHGSWATPGDDQPDAESAVETTGEFTIDYAPPAWYTQNASEAASPASAAGSSASASHSDAEPESGSDTRLRVTVKRVLRVLRVVSGALPPCPPGPFRRCRA